jgi:uncharacterized protein (DUF433 family)
MIIRCDGQSDAPYVILKLSAHQKAAWLAASLAAKELAMKLEDYFDFLKPDAIRIKGHRIGIEHVLYEHIHNAMTPDELAVRFPTLTLEQIYAVLLYYHHNQQMVDAYLADWLEEGRKRWEEQSKNPTSDMSKVRKLAAERGVAQDRDLSLHEVA